MRIPHARISPEVEWREIHSYPDYYVSSTGQVRNISSKLLLTPHVNQVGVTYVTLRQGGRNRNKSLALLVAEAFLEEPWNEAFDTPIHLDGNRNNNWAYNLMWRPRWFAIKYMAQFSGPYANAEHKIEIIETGELTTAWDVVKRYGLLYTNVILAAASNQVENKSPWGTEFSFDYVGNSY